jgi:hypothetical protein
MVAHYGIIADLNAEKPRKLAKALKNQAFRWLKSRPVYESAPQRNALRTQRAMQW